MINTTTEQFEQLFTRLRAAYPILRNMDQDEWALTTEVYWRALQVYSPDLIAEVFDEAVKHWTDFFPTAGQLRASALALWKRHQERDKPQRPLLPGSPGIRPAASENPLKQLARQWFDESRKLGLDPDKETPPEIAARRFKQFWSAWSQTEALNNKQKGTPQ
jgi:hypothetical protein